MFNIIATSFSDISEVLNGEFTMINPELRMTNTDEKSLHNWQEMRARICVLLRDCRRGNVSSILHRVARYSEVHHIFELLSFEL